MKIERKLKNCFNLKVYLLIASFDQDVIASGLSLEYKLCLVGDVIFN